MKNSFLILIFCIVNYASFAQNHQHNRDRRYEDFEGYYNNIDIAYQHEKEAKVLDLRNQNLTELPYKINALVNLEVLILDGNQLTEIPYSLSSLSNLKTLSIRNNNLTGISYSISNLKNLNELILDGNQLTDIPYSLTSLTNLE